MKNEKFVSLWVGNTKSEEELKNYVKLVYTDNGECLSSSFAREFRVNLDEIDEDYIECAHYTQQSDMISILLKGCSYEDEVVRKFNAKFGNNLNSMYNSVILIYDYKHIKTTRLFLKRMRFKYIGFVKIGYDF